MTWNQIIFQGIPEKKDTTTNVSLIEVDSERIFLVFQFIDVKMIPNLVSPFIDDRHVDIIYKNGHFLPRRWSIGGPHPLIHIALYCPLREKQGAQRKKISTQISTQNKKFHSDIISRSTD